MLVTTIDLNGVAVLISSEAVITRQASIFTQTNSNDQSELAFRKQIEQILAGSNSADLTEKTLNKPKEVATNQKSSLNLERD